MRDRAADQRKCGDDRPPAGGWRERPQPARILGLQRQAGNAAVSALFGSQAAPLQVQRNVGVELEESNWQVTDSAGGKVGKGTPLVYRTYFQLQAEDNGARESNIELVTNPPGVVDVAEWRQMKAAMRLLIGQLADQPAGRRFHTTELPGGVPGYWLTPPGGGGFHPDLQVTVGVPLRAVPHFYDLLAGGAQPIADVRPVDTALVRRMAGRKASPELLGSSR
ncbi:hypothetical protein [Fodinicola feengrottensis]|uniref:hypothetical protein n=1 Tax=Fodinicola feengrottensis TaxID=435914 RepID=UPI0013D3ED1E|nr:hypothetical protein [Fodinicola feengrottensis]